MRKKRRSRIQLKSPDEVERMREAGLVVARTLRRLADNIEPGISTADLDDIAASAIAAEGATPSFKGYQGFPATICASVNEEVVHGIPSLDRVLRAGDVISVDCGAIVDGWHGDAAVTVPVGSVSAESARLLDVCEEALWRGLAAGRAGGRLTDIGHAVESYVRGRGRYGVVEEYTGHGIGTRMHMEPMVPNYGKPGRGPILEPGVCLAVEPMVTLGTAETTVLDDDWTVVTGDGRRAAHFEHTFAVTEDGPRVLTAVDDGATRIAEIRASDLARR